MKRVLVIVMAVILSVMGQTGFASAGVYTDDLGKCVVAAATPDDQALFVQLIFAMLSLNPVVKPYASVTDDQRQELSQRASIMVERLIVDDCHKEAVAAFKYEGDVAAMGASFQLLGQVAARRMLTDPSVAAGMGKMNTINDKAKWRTVYTDAGLPIPPGVAEPAR